MAYEPFILCLIYCFLVGANVDSIKMNSRKARQCALITGLVLGIVAVLVCAENSLQAIQFFIIGALSPFLALFIRAELDLKPLHKRCQQGGELDAASRRQLP